MIEAVPADAPVSTPVPDAIDATAGALLVHVPPVGRSLRPIAEPVQTEIGPDNGLGAVVTVIVLVRKQPGDMA